MVFKFSDKFLLMLCFCNVSALEIGNICFEFLSVLWLSGTVPEGSVFDHVEEKSFLKSTNVAVLGKMSVKIEMIRWWSW